MSAKHTKAELRALEARIVAAAMRRYREWLKRYPEGLRPLNEGGVSGAGRSLIIACRRLAKSRGEQS